VTERALHQLKELQTVQGPGSEGQYFSPEGGKKLGGSSEDLWTSKWSRQQMGLEPGITEI